MTAITKTRNRRWYLMKKRLSGPALLEILRCRLSVAEAIRLQAEEDTRFNADFANGLCAGIGDILELLSPGELARRANGQARN